MFKVRGEFSPQLILNDFQEAFKTSIRGLYCPIVARPYFAIFGPNTKIFRLNLHIQFKRGKIRTRKNSIFGQFSRPAIFGIDLQAITYLYLFVQHSEKDSKAMIRNSV